MAAPFRLTSYNLLAESYARPSLYAGVDPALLAWQRRAPAIVQRVAALRPDVVCLQEVEARAWPSLEAAFARGGLHGVYAKKSGGRPDGCALLVRHGAAALLGHRALHFDDGVAGGEASGHLALIGELDIGGDLVRIATTHLRWQADAAGDAHIGHRQARELAAHLAAATPPAMATVICGDLNVAPSSDAIALLLRQGYVDACADAPQPTCNPHRHAERIDFILHGAALRSEPLALPALADDTPMPSATEPSDHLPISADCRFA